MGKGIGIAALVIIIVSFFVPVVGTFVAYFALVIAAVAALAGNKTFAIATTVIAVIKMYFLSPLLMLTMYAPFTDSSAPLAAYSVVFLTTFFAALPIICMIFRPAVAGLLGKVGVSLPSKSGSPS